MDSVSAARAANPLVSGIGFGAPTNAPDENPIVQVGSPAWIITSAVPLMLFVQDLFLSLDQFNMFNNAVDLGNTSANTPGSDCGSDVTACIANAAFSRGTYILPAGSNSLTGIHVHGAPGAAVFELTPVAAPEPSSLAVLGAGLLALAVGLGLLRRQDPAAETAA